MIRAERKKMENWEAVAFHTLRGSTTTFAGFARFVSNSFGEMIMIWLLMLLGNVSAASYSSPQFSPPPVSSCSSDLDCSLNGLCVDQKEGNHQATIVQSTIESDSNHSGSKASRGTNKVCLCDKPWSGSNCETLRFAPVKGTTPKIPNRTIHQDIDSHLHSVATTAIATQGYGMEPNVTTWGGGILAEASTDSEEGSSSTVLYHLYVARMTNDCPLATWTTNSRIDHAVSSSITGPYRFVDVAIPTFSHNPAPIELKNPQSQQPKVAWKYAIFHIGNGTGAEDGGKDCRNSNGSNGQGNSSSVRDTEESTRISRLRIQRTLLGTNTPKYPNGTRRGDDSDRPGSNIHVSNSLNGPWTPLLHHGLGRCNNPAPWVHPGNGTLFVLCNYGGKTTELFKSQTGDVSGPYELVTTFQPHAPGTNAATTAYEDPSLYTDPRGNFHIIYHAYQKTGPSSDCRETLVSAHAYSPDGFEWHTSPVPPYGSRVEVSDASGPTSRAAGRVTLASRERPKLYFGHDDGRLTHMVEGVCGVPACDPSPYKPWCVHCKYQSWDFTLVSTLV